ncbi:hypothetical protein [Robinsoniella peoriensis]|uniref:hypothetical protein n=1 Tax=Robinsoniella peoriensis TaxID=180332 RepID=UPI00362CED4F
MKLRKLFTKQLYGIVVISTWQFPLISNHTADAVINRLSNFWPIIVRENLYGQVLPCIDEFNQYR